MDYWRIIPIQKEASIVGNVLFEKGDAMQVDPLLLHPLLFEAKPFHFGLAPFTLQLPIVFKHQIDSFLQLLKSISIPFL